MWDEFGFGNFALKRHVTCSALTQLQKLKFFMFYVTGFTALANSVEEERAVWVGICCVWVWGISLSLHAESHGTASENAELHQIVGNKG